MHKKRKLSRGISLRIFLAICFLMLAIIVVVLLSSQDFTSENIQASAVNSAVSKYTLRLNKSGNGTGVAVSNPAGIDCGATCKNTSYSFARNQSVTLKATASSGSIFMGWSGNCSGAGDCVVKMSTARSVTAKFDVARTLNVSVTGTGSGRVTGTGITCPTDCNETYKNGTSVSLKAVADNGSVFTSWNGCNRASGTTCNITMSQEKQVKATFSLKQNIPTGSLKISTLPAPTTPAAGQLVMGSSENTFVVLSFATDATESVKITRIVITDKSVFGGSINDVKLFSVGTGSSVPAQIGSTVHALNNKNNGKATFDLTDPWVIPVSTTYYLVVKAGINAYPNATSGSTHVLSLYANTDIDTYGVSSGKAIKETGLPAGSYEQDVYRTKLGVYKNASSPSGAAVAGNNSEILRFDMSANSNYSVWLGAIALTLSGNTDITGSGNAALYDMADMSTPIKTEVYKATTCNSNSGNVLTVQNSEGIPVGANVTLWGAGKNETRKVIAATDITHITLDSYPTIICNGTSTLYYRPLQPGSGKLYFGAETTLDTNLSTIPNTIKVASIEGFAVGDQITLKGSGNGTATITGLSKNLIYYSGKLNPSTITVSVGGTVTVTATMDGGQAIAYEGIDPQGSIGSTIAAGTTSTYVVKGDTTGATTNENLRADIVSAADFLWSDTLTLLINTDTSTFPVTGGNLTY